MQTFNGFLVNLHAPADADRVTSFVEPKPLGPDPAKLPRASVDVSCVFSPASRPSLDCPVAPLSTSPSSNAGEKVLAPSVLPGVHSPATEVSFQTKSAITLFWLALSVVVPRLHSARTN